MTNITPNAWQQISASNFTNFLFSAVQLVPGKKGREGGKNSRDECPSPTSRRVDHGTMKWSSRHVLVTALLRTSDITISLWLMQTFVQIAGNVLSHPSPLPPLSVVPTNASYAVHTCARRCNERVCKCVCHDYTSSSSVCNCSPFVPQVARKQRAAWRWNVIPCEFCWTRGGGNKNRYAGFIIEIFSFDNIIVASHARVVCSNDIAVSKLAIRDWLEKWFFSLSLFRFLMERFSPWRVKGNR